MTDTTAVPFTHELSLSLQNDLMEKIELTYQKSKDYEVFFLTRGDMLRHALSTGLTYISNHLEEWHENYVCNEDASFRTLNTAKMEQPPFDDDIPF